MSWHYTDPMRTLAVLPSRFQATRFPGKPLTSIAGKPMIQWVFEAASRARGVDRVVVATDDDRIASTVRGFGGEALMTDPALPSGTDRTAAAMDALGESFDCVLNIQGDEPAMHPDTVAAVVALMHDQPDLPMGTAACPFADMDELFNPNAVKVVMDDRKRALYFSRSPIPYLRNSSPFRFGFPALDETGPADPLQASSWPLRLPARHLADLHETAAAPPGAARDA